LASVLRWIFLTALATYFFVPLIAMARFAFQSVPTALLTPETMFTGWGVSGLWDAVTDPLVLQSVRVSLTLVILTILLNLVLLIPLAVVVEVRSPRMKPALTAVTLLPWVVPPIALVVGVAATFRVTVPWFLASDLSLVPFYAMWSMPFTYRALDNGLRAINARTLVEAGRSLGASLWTIVFRIILPNLRTSMIAASALTGALVLGEFAFASLLLKETLPVVMLTYQRGNPRGGLAFALVVMVLTAALLWVIIRALRRRGVAVHAAGI
jgi:putative spermidine/putrescine transport system permease protein